MKMPDIEALNDYNTKTIKEITKFYKKIMENQNAKILNERGEKKMSNKTRGWLTDWIETETNKVDGSAKEKKKENISKTENFIRDWIASETTPSVFN